MLILGGTTEARELASACAGEAEVVTSLAGVVAHPARPSGDVRTGGFGGPDGLAAYLQETGIEAIVDATHPFAATITGSAVEAAATTGTPLLVLRRPGWTARDGDDWRRVPTLAAAAELVPQLGRRVFLSTGRRGLAAFADTGDCWFLARTIEPPAPPLPRYLTVVTARGPFPIESERALLTEHRIDVIVTKDSGGAAAKLDAARELGIPVILVDRPPLPPGADRVTTVEQAVRWLRERTGGGAGTCP